MRQELAAQGRAVAADHTVEANAWRTWEAWHEARQRRLVVGASFSHHA